MVVTSNVGWSDNRVAMASISERDRSVFAEAHNSILDSFTDAEQEQIHAAAYSLRTVLSAAKKRLAGPERGFEQVT